MIQLMKGKMTCKCLWKNKTRKFRELTEAPKDFLNNLGSALDNSVSKTSKSIDEILSKVNSVHTSWEPENLNRERQEAGTPSSDPNEKSRSGPAKVLGNPSKMRIISQDNDSLSLFAPSDVEDDLQRQEDNPLQKVMFVVNDTEPQSEGHTDDTLCKLTEEFNNNELCDQSITAINLKLVRAIYEVWIKKLTPEKLKNKTK